MKIISRRQYVEGAHVHERFYEWENTPGAGFSFECDEHGNVNVDKLYPAGKESYRQCVDGSIRSRTGEKVIDRGVRCRELRGYWRAAVGRCDCGREVVLSGFTNTCDCGADYNSVGQRLAPRSQWGEETGESASDILRGDDWY